ncbi:FAD-binding dehydrogenase [Streptomyces albidoflavus]|uniref:FAD-binding dehydrogenase n=1 Tax=Streptomyces albidoflavus TaxID=1886 RepID=UPI00101E72DB|nr:FAD-binding dehydrogenase [Streptomyces albidoflavus]RZD92204.1 FAD-binding dehydrogenase [Streptomyces albidoflavus]RZD96860.1 FAD-binding dehydrogenase [Streptomyces albidoflavus]
MAYDADVIVIGAGLAGLAATAELVDAGRKVILLDQEPEQSIGGQAHWSFGGLFFVDSPEQRRLRIKDSHALALQDWLGTAGFDREEDHWPRRWAEAYVDFAAGEKRAWLHGQGVRFFPVVGWAERGGYDAGGHGNSVPRFHITWGTGPGLVAPFERRVREGVARGLVELRFRHRVTGLGRGEGSVDTVTGEILEPSTADRGLASSREVAGAFELRAQAVIVTSGGIGGNHDLVRRNWPERLGTPPKKLLSGVPAHVDGLMLDVAAEAGGNLINGDRMWHYTEGIENWNPIWARHGIRILPGPSSIWLDATGNRLPVPLFPGFDTLGTLEHIMRTGHEHTWFVLNQRIIGKEFTLSGSEQNPDLTGRSVRGVLQRARADVPAPVKAFMDQGADFVVERELPALVRGMNALTDEPLVDEAALHRTLTARDREITNPFTKDSQITAIRGARSYLGDRLIRAAAPHAILDPAAGPLVAVRLNILTRKSLGGLQTDLSSRVLTASGEPLPGVYAAGEAAGFGGGGVHGYRSLEGTFLGGCLFSGRTAGRAAAEATA